MNFLNGRAAAKVLQSYLKNRFDSDYQSEFADYGGVDISHRLDEDSNAQQAGKPMIEFYVARDAMSEFADLDGKYRDCVLRATVKASEFAGARTGTANPEGSDTKLARALAEIIEEDYSVLREMGLDSIRLDGEDEQSGGLDDDSAAHQISHSILFRYNRP
jgi:hypothetical protein